MGKQEDEDAYWNKRLKTPVRFGLDKKRKDRKLETDKPYSPAYIEKKLIRLGLPIEIKKDPKNKGPGSIKAGVWLIYFKGTSYNPFRVDGDIAANRSVREHYATVLEYLQSKGWRHPNPPLEKWTK